MRPILLAMGGLALAAAVGGTPQAAREGMVAPAAAISDDGVPGKGPGVPEEVLEKTFAKARKELRKGLEKHAEWCNSAKLYLERNGVYRRILVLDPDHFKARTGLGYTKDRDGNWKDPDPKKHKPPKNYSPSNLKKAARKLTEALEPYTDRLYDFLDARGPELSPDQFHRMVSEILSMDPEDERAHGLLGHVKIEVKNEETGKKEPAWVLVETATAKERRRTLSKLVRDLFKAIPEDTVVEPNSRDARIALPWKALLSTGRFRVVGTVPVKEARQTLGAVHVAEGYFRGIFGKDTRLDDGLTVYLLEKPEQKFAFIEGHPGPGPDDREYLKKLDGSGIPGSQDIGHWAKSAQRRADGVVRIALGSLFTGAFNITTRDAWIYEGFGLYMTYAIVRSRLNWFALPTGDLLDAEEQALRTRMVNPKTVWMQEAYVLLQQEEHPAIRDVFGKSMNTLTTHDLLLSYVLAAFLLEAHPDETPAILAAIGEGKDEGLVLREALGLGVDELETRILRWLSERR